MGEVIVRQWGPDCYAAYVVGSGQYPEFVGVESSRTDAERLAESRLAATGSECVSGPSEQLCVGELGEESDGPRVLDNPGPSAPEAAGATP